MNLIKMNIKFLSYFSWFTLLSLFVACGPEEEEEILQDVELSECDVVPNLINTKRWSENYPYYLEDTITLGALAPYNNKLYLVDNNIFDADVYEFDFDQEQWMLANDSTVFNSLETIYQTAETLPWGLRGIEIVGDTLFTVGIQRETFGAIDLNNQEFVYSARVALPERFCRCSAIAYDYPYAYVAYHENNYSVEVETTQRLWGIDVRSNEVIFDKPLHPSENRNDSAHGLTTFKNDVWHVKDENLTQMDGKTGEIKKVYDIGHGKRSSSICYYNKSLWVSNYYGGLFEVPLECAL